ncbi:hypothetical protein HanRHA438_Chr03g0113971 [Helianthus annuus]|nr:hypothetical protein HanRHA438_Chr03g0113971 [Helianthus annuus]
MSLKELPTYKFIQYKYKLAGCPRDAAGATLCIVTLVSDSFFYSYNIYDNIIVVDICHKFTHT